MQGVLKNVPTSFCQNSVKSQPNFIVFGTLIAKTIKLCETHSLFTSPPIWFDLDG